MDPAEARRQRESLEALRRLEDIVGDMNAEIVRLEGFDRKILEVVIDANDVARRTHEATLGSLELVLDELREIRRDMRGEGGAGVREPREPAPESPGDAIALGEDE